MFLRCREVLEERLDGLEISRGLEEAMEMVFEASSTPDHVVRVRYGSLTVYSQCAGQPIIHRPGTLEANNERQRSAQRHGLCSRSTSLDRHCLVAHHAQQDNRTARQPDGQPGDAYMAAFGLGRRRSSGSGRGERQVGWVRGEREEAGLVPCADGRAGGMRPRCNDVDHRTRMRTLSDLTADRACRSQPETSDAMLISLKPPTHVRNEPARNPRLAMYPSFFPFFDNSWRSAFTSLFYHGPRR
jgi:hypothetical protein